MRFTPQQKECLGFIERLLKVEKFSPLVAMRSIDNIKVMDAARKSFNGICLKGVESLTQSSPTKFLSLMYIMKPELLWMRIFLDHDLSRYRKGELDHRKLMSTYHRYENLLYRTDRGVSPTRAMELYEVKHGFELIKIEEEAYKEAYHLTLRQFRDQLIGERVESDPSETSEMAKKCRYWRNIFYHFPKEAGEAVRSQSMKKLEQIMQIWSKEIMALKKYIEESDDETLVAELKKILDSTSVKHAKIYNQIIGDVDLKAPIKAAASYHKDMDRINNDEYMIKLGEKLHGIRRKTALFSEERLKVERAQMFIDDFVSQIVNNRTARFILRSAPGSKGYYSHQDCSAFLSMIFKSIERGLKHQLKGMLKVDAADRKRYPVDSNKSKRMNTIVSKALKSSQQKYFTSL